MTVRLVFKCLNWAPRLGFVAGALIVKSSHSSFQSSSLLLGGTLALAGLAHAQAGVSPEAAPGRDEAQEPAPTLTLPSASPTPLPSPGATPLPGTTPPPEGVTVPQGSQLTAARVAYEGGTIVAQGDATNPVLFQSGLGRVQASEIRLDTIAQTLNATGQVTLTREVDVSRRQLRSRQLTRLYERERSVETAYGQNLTFDFKTQQGSLDTAVLKTSQVDFRADHLEINGQKYVARHVVIRPGGLSDEELRIYGTPPLNLRAREVNVRRDAASNRTSIGARGAGLYFKSTRILPLPAALLRYGTGGNSQGFRITPSLSYNSANGAIITAKFGFPLARDPRALSLNFDVGLSQRVGFRGGPTLSSTQQWGDLNLSLLKSDVVRTQLSNRIELDRKPELTYQSPSFGIFNIPRLGRSGFSVDAGYGRFTERLIGSDNTSGPVSSDRVQGRLLFTTRLNPTTGPFLRAFASTARYSDADTHYNTAGVQVGYGGRLLKQVTGEVSLRLTGIGGQTPFRFDLVEIPRELRTTFDVSVTPRYVLPFDLRYDLDRSKIRDATFGLLRSYKVFAYGVVYQTARQDLRLEVRSGF